MCLLPHQNRAGFSLLRFNINSILFFPFFFWHKIFTVSVGLQTAALVITCFIFEFKRFVIWSIKLYNRSGLVMFSVLSKPEQASVWWDFHKRKVNNGDHKRYFTILVKKNQLHLSVIYNRLSCAQGQKDVKHSPSDIR